MCIRDRILTCLELGFGVRGMPEEECQFAVNDAVLLEFRCNVPGGIAWAQHDKLLPRRRDRNIDLPGSKNGKGENGKQEQLYQRAQDSV